MVFLKICFWYLYISNEVQDWKTGQITCKNDYKLYLAEIYSEYQLNEARNLRDSIANQK